MQIVPLTDTMIPSLVDALRAGQTLVYPTETCYGLGCDATNQDAVDRIFSIKQRQATKSVLVVMPDIAMIQHYVVWTDHMAQLADRYWPGPLTIVGDARVGTDLADGVLSSDGTIAFRCSSHPFVEALAGEFGRPIVSTSANISSMDSPYDSTSVREMFDTAPVQPDILIDAGVLAEQSPSTIVRVKDGVVEVLRQGSIVIEEYLL